MFDFTSVRDITSDYWISVTVVAMEIGMCRAIVDVILIANDV